MIQNGQAFKIDPFLKNKPTHVGINVKAPEKLKINPLGQDMAILKCILNKRDMIWTKEDSCCSRDRAS